MRHRPRKVGQEAAAQPVGLYETIHIERAEYDGRSKSEHRPEASQSTTVGDAHGECRDGCH